MRRHAACIAAVFALAGVASAATFTSVQDGGWAEPATWGNVGQSLPGATIPGDGDTVNLHNQVTMNTGDSYVAGENRAFWHAGGALVQNGGGFYTQGRADLGIGGASNSVTVYGGYVGFDRVDNTGGPHAFSIYGGEFEYTGGMALFGPSDYLIDGGRLSLGGTNISGSGSTFDLRSGTWDLKLSSGTFVSSANVTWTGGAMANPGQPHDYFQDILGDMGDESDDVLIDITDQTRRSTAQTWNMKSSDRDRYGRLNSNGGHIQFDVYSAATDDSDDIINAADNSQLGAGVLFDIGYAGPAITDPAAFVGTSYKLLSMVTSTNFGNLTPTVPVATWDDGQTLWTVSFQNDISTDGTVTITSIVPEPATLALLGLGGLAVLRRKR